MPMTATTSQGRQPRLFAFAVSALLTLVLLASALAPRAQAVGGLPGAGHPELTVMTRNIYLGANLTPAITAQDFPSFLVATTGIWNQMLATNFPDRAVELAQEIQREGPEIVGLQEVALWRRGPDGVLDGPATPATQVHQDFLQILRDELAALGLNYQVASNQQEFDFEAPTLLGFDARLTMRDVILVKRNRFLPGRVRVLGQDSDNFQNNLVVTTAAGNITVLRGWNRIDARVGLRRFRLINTHLEAFSQFHRQAQAQELIAPGGPVQNAAPYPVILIGDLNSDDPPVLPGDELAYQALTGFGFQRRGAPEDSCCHDGTLLLNPDPFDHIVDHVLTLPGLKQLGSSVTGGDPAERTPGGLWPSDHGGVVSELQIFPG
jgi:endonuclease/exonuclease/phosphatase family metal-dependent hydrolase